MVGTFLLFGIMIAAFFPFFAIFLKDKGFDPDQIGLVLAAMAIARVITNPVSGHLADSRFGRLRVLQAGVAFASLMAVALFFATRLWPIAAASFLFAVGSSASGPNVDAIALVQLGEERMADYARIRATESFSYAVACLIYGAILQASGTRWSMVLYAAAGMFLVLWSVRLPKDPPKGEVSHGRLGTLGAVFRRSPRFPFYLLSAFLVWTGFNAAWNFFSLRIEAAGGGPFLVGVGTALGGLVEVPVMLSVPKLHRRFGLRITWFIGAVVYATGFLLWGLVDNAKVVSFLTVFEGAGFALLFTSGVVIVGKLVPRELYSTGQSVSSVMGLGLGPIVGAGVGGFIFQSLGPVWLYSLAALSTLAGGVVGWFALNAPGLREGLQGPEDVVGMEIGADEVAGEGHP
jgi:PPP family 3-phenylpropionic acid transporter